MACVFSAGEPRAPPAAGEGRPPPGPLPPPPRLPLTPPLRHPQAGASRGTPPASGGSSWQPRPWQPSWDPEPRCHRCHGTMARERGREREPPASRSQRDRTGQQEGWGHGDSPAAQPCHGATGPGTPRQPQDASGAGTRPFPGSHGNKDLLWDWGVSGGSCGSLGWGQLGGGWGGCSRGLLQPPHIPSSPASRASRRAMPAARVLLEGSGGVCVSPPGVCPLPAAHHHLLLLLLLRRRVQPWGQASPGQGQGCLWLSYPSPGWEGVRDGSCPLCTPEPPPLPPSSPHRCPPAPTCSPIPRTWVTPADTRQP